MDVLMFIGGGSAGTAGGIKVTTFGLLAFVLWSEIRGEPDVVVGRRRVPASTQRQAVTVALLGVGLVVSASFVLQALTPYPFDLVLFETISAFATVGTVDRDHRRPARRRAGDTDDLDVRRSAGATHAGLGAGDAGPPPALSVA